MQNLFFIVSFEKLGPEPFAGFSFGQTLHLQSFALVIFYIKNTFAMVSQPKCSEWSVFYLLGLEKEKTEKTAATELLRSKSSSEPDASSLAKDTKSTLFLTYP